MLRRSKCLMLLLPSWPRCADLLRFFRQHDLHTILVPDVQARQPLAVVTVRLYSFCQWLCWVRWALHATIRHAPCTWPHSAGW